MVQRMLLALALAALPLGCSDDDDAGTSRRTYCYNGAGYSCGDQASYDQCVSKKECGACTRDDSVCK